MSSVCEGTVDVNKGADMTQMMMRGRMSDAARFDAGVRGDVARARERFLAGDLGTAGVGLLTPEILSSWTRSFDSGVDPEGVELPVLRAETSRGRRLADTCEPIMRALGDQCRDSDTWGLLLDRECVQVHPNVGDERLVREGMERGGGVGATYREASVGTNGAGISVERLEPFMVVAEEHYRTSEHNLVSVGVPLRDIFGRLAGVLVMCQRIASANHMIVPYAQSIARSIDEQIALASDGDERTLFDAFSRHSRRPSLAVVGVSDHVFVANNAAQQLLREFVDADLLRRTVLEVAAAGRSRLLSLRLGHDHYRVHCRVVELSRGRRGAVASLTRVTEPSPTAVDAPGPEGEATPIHRAAALGLPVLVVGEQGSGRAHAVHGVGTCAEIDATSAALDPAAWIERLETRSRAGAVLIRDLDALGQKVLHRTLEVVRSAPQWVAATATRPLPEVESTFPVTVEVAPLRERTTEIAAITEDLLTALGGRGVRCAPEAMSILARNRWPGNIGQLRRVLAAALVSCRGQVITLDDLPREIAVSGLTVGDEGLLARTERELVFGALRSASWNRDAAAQSLGISRATMYRRIRQFGFQIPSSR
ncbi:helix-turn-helix domain-containing protein [Microbacterium sp. 18062]|uniref:sigma-54-dependent Fis family transcriptional regulator n=1 Tax=Microbacterium sp. 18062 TaxID=2681410 RepID=UPI00135BEBB1|nr:helix-turn-helix domain-containing protein [Microbacterium sp. 18062]